MRLPFKGPRCLGTMRLGERGTPDQKRAMQHHQATKSPVPSWRSAPAPSSWRCLPCRPWAVADESPAHSPAPVTAADRGPLSAAHLLAWTDVEHRVLVAQPQAAAPSSAQQLIGHFVFTSAASATVTGQACASSVRMRMRRRSRLIKFSVATLKSRTSSPISTTGATLPCLQSLLVRLALADPLRGVAGIAVGRVVSEAGGDGFGLLAGLELHDEEVAFLDDGKGEPCRTW